MSPTDVNPASRNDPNLATFCDAVHPLSTTGVRHPKQLFTGLRRRYTIQSLLGRGGLGDVYQAHDPKLDRTVAIKLLRSTSLIDLTARARFATEAQFLAKLNHPQIIRIYEIGELGHDLFLSLEYVDGSTLASRLRDGPLAAADVVELGILVANALQHSHEQHVVHRDLKPSNILLEADSLRPKIADFGLAQLTEGESHLTQTGLIAGTPCYMAPEQTLGLANRTQPAVDIWALGVVLYECLHGQPPFLGATSLQTLQLVQTAEPTSLRLLHPSLHRDLDVIVQTCLQKEPHRRYSSMAALAEDLERFRTGRPILARPSSRLVKATKWIRRNPALAALVLLAMVVPIVFGVLSTLHNRELQSALTAKTNQEQIANREKSRADDNYRHAKTALTSILSHLQDRRYTDVPRLKELQRAQIEDALKYYRTLAEVEQTATIEAQADAAFAVAEMARYNLNLQKSDDAIRQIAAARTAFANLTQTHLAKEDWQRAYAVTLSDEVSIKPMSPEDGIRQLQQAAAILQQLPTLRDDPQTLTMLANVENGLGAAYHRKKDLPAAEPHFRRSLAIRESLTQREPTNSEFQRRLATSHINLSDNMRLQQQLRAAEEHYLAGTRLLQRLVETDEINYDSAYTLSIAQVNWSYHLRESGRRAEALTLTAESVRLLERLEKLEPHLFFVRDGLLRLHGVRTEMFSQQKDHAAASHEGRELLRYANGDSHRFHSWFTARSEAEASELEQALQRLQNQLPKLTPTVGHAEPQHGAETAAMIVQQLSRQAAVVGTPSVAHLQFQAEVILVELLKATRLSAGKQWPNVAKEIAEDVTFRCVRTLPAVRQVLNQVQ